MKVVALSVYHHLWGRLQDQPELRRYYLYQLMKDIGGAAGARFAMAWFFFNAGLTVQEVILLIMCYAASCLVIMEPVRWLVNKLGVRKVYMLHLIPSVITFGLTLLAVKQAMAGEPFLALLFAKLTLHSGKVMLSRIPTTAHFSFYGKPETRGADLGLASIFQRFAAIASPVLLGALIDESGLIPFVIFGFVCSLFSSFIFGFKKDENLKVNAKPFSYWKKVPLKVSKTFFFQRMGYHFMDDLFFIWVVMQFGGSYKAAGIFYGVKLAMDMFLSYLVGKYTDLEKVRSAYILGVLLTSIFWLVVPFAESGWVIAILQFTVGLAGLVIDIPFEREYHNLAQESNDSLGWAMWREIVIQLGIVAGGVLSLILLQFVDDWHWLIMIGFPCSLAWLWLTPAKK